MEKRLQIVYGVLAGGLLLIAAIPYSLMRTDNYVRLGTIVTNGTYFYTSQERGILVNVIFEPKTPVNELKINGLMVLSFDNTQRTQNLHNAQFSAGLIHTNWFYMQPMFVQLPKKQKYLLTINVTNINEVPFDVILRYRTYRMPGLK
jgi:hypothetical protein